MIDNNISLEQNQEPLKHSGMGIASFVIAIAQGILTVIVIVVAGILTTMGPQSEHQGAFMIVGLVIMGGMLLHLIGIGLGIAGACQKNRKKIFSILGLILNICAILIVVFLIVVGMMAKNTGSY